MSVVLFIFFRERMKDKSEHVSFRRVCDHRPPHARMGTPHLRLELPCVPGGTQQPPALHNNPACFSIGVSTHFWSRPSHLSDPLSPSLVRAPHLPSDPGVPALACFLLRQCRVASVGLALARGSRGLPCTHTQCHNGCKTSAMMALRP